VPLPATGPSALDPQGSGAERIAELWWFMLAAGGVVYVTVMGALFLALRRRGRGQADASESHAVAFLFGGIVLPAIVITATFVLTARPGGPLFAMAGPSSLSIQVTGHQWFWSVDYPEQGIATANELHVPVGIPVELELRSADVIHSFWVPQLNGKLDVMPQKANRMTIEALEPGVYRGECAEFCGVQHAKMQLLVIAEPPEDFDAWVARMAQPASEPTTSDARRGLETFMASGCGACHTIGGTSARGTLGPDLTHVGSRRTLGAASIPNTRGHLGGWVVDAQSAKPGNKMPPQTVPADELPRLLDYLQSLD
jgi:cytochrome c oxidase subunit 2